LSAWGASGPYKKVYEKFGLTGTREPAVCVRVVYTDAVFFLDVATVAKKVVDFYQKKGGEVVSPLVKAL